MQYKTRLKYSNSRLTDRDETTRVLVFRLSFCTALPCLEKDCNTVVETSAIKELLMKFRLELNKLCDEFYQSLNKINVDLCLQMRYALGYSLLLYCSVLLLIEQVSLVVSSHLNLATGWVVLLRSFFDEFARIGAW